MKSKKKPVEVTLTVTLSKEEYEAIYKEAKKNEKYERWKDWKALLVRQELANSVYASVTRKTKGLPRPEERIKPVSIMEADSEGGDDANLVTYQYYYFLDDDGERYENFQRELRRCTPWFE